MARYGGQWRAFGVAYARWRRISLLAVAGAALLAGLAGACSDSSSGAIACGPGTTLADKECVVADSSVANDDATVANDSAGSPGEGSGDAAGDSPAPDGGATADALSTGDSMTPGDASVPEDASPQDGSDGPDPCYGADGPPYPIINCDPSCPWATPDACTATCGATRPYSFGPNGGFPKFIRTPQAPGTDPQCALACPDGGFVYGFWVGNSTGSGFQIDVEAPWVALTGTQTPFCGGRQGFLMGTTHHCNCSSTGDVFLMTTDPNAPARNVKISIPPVGTCCGL